MEATLKSERLTLTPDMSDWDSTSSPPPPAVLLLEGKSEPRPDRESPRPPRPPPDDGGCCCCFCSSYHLPKDMIIVVYLMQWYNGWVGVVRIVGEWNDG